MPRVAFRLIEDKLVVPTTPTNCRWKTVVILCVAAPMVICKMQGMDGRVQHNANTYPILEGLNPTHIRTKFPLNEIVGAMFWMNKAMPRTNSFGLTQMTLGHWGLSTKSFLLLKTFGVCFLKYDFSFLRSLFKGWLLSKRCQSANLPITIQIQSKLKPAL